MIRLSALGFALALATSAQAMPVPSPHQPDGMITVARMPPATDSVLFSLFGSYPTPTL